MLNLNSLFKGWFGEKKTTFWMWLSLNAKVYKRYHNLILPSKNGTAQIDHLIVSPFGLFIIETKNRSGWIFGSADQKSWTQVLFNEKYSFQNPLTQIYRQKKVLADFLGLKGSSIYTIVYFVGDCQFKTQMPENVLKWGLGRYIKQFRNPILSQKDLERITQSLDSYQSESTLTNKDHVRSLRRRHSSRSHCPKCGADLVLRTAKTGANAGSTFLGCSGYPTCRFSRSV